MSDKSTTSGIQSTLSELPTWKKRLHIIAGILLVVGLGMKGIAWVSGGGSGGSDSGSDGDAATVAQAGDKTSGNLGTKEKGTGTGTALVPDGLPPIGAKTPETGEKTSSGSERDSSDGSTDEPFLEEWSPTMVKGGLSFFVAFWVGFSIRVFARICGLFLALFALGVLGLTELGWLTVEWSVAQDQFAELPTFLKSQVSGFKAFLQGSLPSAGMAGVGLFAGLKKK